MKRIDPTGFVRPVGALTVAVDDAHCIVLITPDDKQYTISNVEALRNALEDARTYVQIIEESGVRCRYCGRTFAPNINEMCRDAPASVLYHDAR